MSLVKTETMFKLFPAKAVYKQKVKVRPIEHHYEEEGEPPYIKYSCPICEQLAEKLQTLPLYLIPDEDYDDKDGKFVRFSFPEGTKQCPCCGINIDWNYKR